MGYSVQSRWGDAVNSLREKWNELIASKLSVVRGSQKDNIVGCRERRASAVRDLEVYGEGSSGR